MRVYKGGSVLHLLDKNMFNMFALHLHLHPHLLFQNTKNCFFGDAEDSPQLSGIINFLACENVKSIVQKVMIKNC